MAARIHIYDFITLGGTVTPPGQMTEDLTPLGVDGLVLRRTGARAPVHSLEPKCDFLSLAALNQAIADVVALKGELVQIEDDIGNIARQVLVREVQHVRSQKVGCPVGGVVSGAFLLTLRLEVQMTR